MFEYLNHLMRQYNLKEAIIIIGIIMIIMVVVMYIMIQVHILIHELSHFIFGWLTGYELLSIRVGKNMLLKKDGKFKFVFLRRISSSGQCIMYPTKEVYKRKAFVLYQLGGVLANFFVGILSFIILMKVQTILIKIFLITSFLCGITLAFANIIKNPFTKILNDGMNLSSILKCNDLLKYFYFQLEIYKLLIHNIPYHKMNLWIPLEKSLISENLVAYSQVLNYYQYLDKLEFDKAYECLKPFYYVLENLELGIKYELVRELLFCEIIGHRDFNVYKNEFSFISQDISSLDDVNELRVRYVIELYVRNNKDIGNMILDRIHKVYKNYFYTGDVFMNLKLIHYFKRKEEE